MKLVSDSFDFNAYIQGPVQTEKIVLPSIFRDRVLHRFYGREIVDAPTLPWAKTHADVKLRPGETSIWAGVNGHGKSLVTGQVALHLAQQGKKVCIASFEMPGEVTLQRLIRQACGGSEPTERYIDRFNEWADGKIYIFDQEGTCDQRVLRGVMRYAATELGVEHFFVDSLMKVVKSESDFDAQKNWIDEAIAIGKDHKMHQHIVAHIRKGESEYEVPDKFDVRGSGSIIDLVDNCFMVWRNKKKEEQLRLPTLKTEEREKLERTPCTLLIVAKQRNHEWEGKIGLYKHEKSMSFVEYQHSQHCPLQLPPDLAVVEKPKQDTDVMFEW